MNDQKLNAKGRKKYWFGVLAVTALNGLLTAFLLNASPDQRFDDKFQNQKLVGAEVVKQESNPLQITVSYIDNTALSFQSVHLILQNIGNKPVRAYSLLGDIDTNGRVISTSFATRFLKAGELTETEMQIERQIIKTSSVLRLSIDYVEYSDGSSWGKDIHGKSKLIGGERAGRAFAIKYLRGLIKSGKTADVTNLLGQKISELVVSVPEPGQSDEWKTGYRRGYKAIVSILQKQQPLSVVSFSKKLDELEEFALEEPL